MIPHDRRRCDSCSWHGTQSEVLKGASPFDGSTIHGCPKCHGIDTIVVCCDEPGCFDSGTIGHPGTDGGPYRVTCWLHSRWAKERKEGGK